MFRRLTAIVALLAAANAPAAEFPFQDDSAPFRLTYGGARHAGSFPETWDHSATSSTAADGVTRATHTWADPATGLEARLDTTRYPAFGAVEWVLHFTNRGEADTPILEDVHAGRFAWKVAGPVTLHHAEGSHALITDFQPRTTELEPGKAATFAPFGGRPSDGVLPFFNLATPAGGLMVAVGWTGQWCVSFQRGDADVTVEAGWERARFTLRPGESVRTPSVLVMPWSGADVMDGQNQFRRMLLAHFIPRQGGQLPDTLLAASPHAAIPFEGTTEANMIAAIDNIAARKLPVTHFWIDAGWYVSPEENWARGVGNLGPDPARFPQGMKPVADAARKAGLRFLLWFEPERVMADTDIFKAHPDWLIPPPADLPPELRYQFNDKFHLFDLGNPAAAAWITETVSRAVAETGVDVYRNDFNMYPGFYWRAGEAPDRQGISEIKYVQGLYRFFDTLRERHPGLLIDNCASGGRRIDLEMMRRSLVLTRSDYLWDPTGQQCHTLGLARWIPLTGIGAASTGPYECRSGYGAHYTLAVDYYAEDPEVWRAAQKALEECRQIAPLARGDFHPLTPHSTANNTWAAWQFHDPKTGRGAIQAFRRPDCATDTLETTLRGLQPGQTYTATNADTDEARTFTADSQGHATFPITTPTQPGATLWWYAIATK